MLGGDAIKYKAVWSVAGTTDRWKRTEYKLAKLVTIAGHMRLDEKQYVKTNQTFNLSTDTIHISKT